MTDQELELLDKIIHALEARASAIDKIRGNGQYDINHPAFLYGLDELSIVKRFIESMKTKPIEDIIKGFAT